MTGGQEDEEAMNKEHQFWIKERDIYSARLDEEKRYGCVTMNLSSTQPADKLLVYDGNWDTSQNRILSLLQSSESYTHAKTAISLSFLILILSHMHENHHSGFGIGNMLLGQNHGRDATS
jgi:hypothetical protein